MARAPKTPSKKPAPAAKSGAAKSGAAKSGWSKRTLTAQALGGIDLHDHGLGLGHELTAEVAALAPHSRLAEAAEGQA